MKTPPRDIPSELLEDYTLKNTIGVESWYFNDSGAFNGLRYDRKEFLSMIADAKMKKSKNYPETDYFLHNALQDHPIKDKVVVIMGSGNPWYEAIAVANGCKHCYVIEYQKRYLNHLMVTYLTVEEYNANPIQFDLGISISSFEHDGLGRYGDPLNPEGDLLAMNNMKSVIKKEGLLYLAVPTGTDKVVWNAHRIYGKIRLPILLEGWELISTYGDPKFDVDHGKDAPAQPLFILKNS